MSAGIIGRRSTRHRNRRTGPNKPQTATPIGIVSVMAAGSVLTFVFDQPVSLKGVPQYGTNIAGPTPVSALLTGPATMTVTFTASVATATEVNIPFEDPAVRNASGGFVSPTQFGL